MINRLDVSIQGYSIGITQWLIYNGCTSPMKIHKIFPFVDYNQQLKHLDTQLNELTNRNSVKVPKVFRSTNKKTIVINSPIFAPSPQIYTYLINEVGKKPKLLGRRMFVRHSNRYIITWMLHQIFIDSTLIKEHSQLD